MMNIEIVAASYQSDPHDFEIVHTMTIAGHDVAWVRISAPEWGRPHHDAVCECGRMGRSERRWACPALVAGLTYRAVSAMEAVGSLYMFGQIPIEEPSLDDIVLRLHERFMAGEWDGQASDQTFDVFDLQLITNRPVAELEDAVERLRAAGLIPPRHQRSIE